MMIRQDFLRPQVTLALLHSAGAAPHRTTHWLTHRHVQTVLHLQAHRIQDYGRLARFLTGRAVGLVLSGGAARGFAGIGVLQALHTLGIPVDAVGGVSSGALVSAMYAAGISTNEMLDRLTHWKMMLQSFDFTLPLVSFSSGYGFDRVLRGLFGEIRLEDLPLPCFFVSTNLTRARQRVSDRGDLCEHLKASNAMPGMLPPVSLDGDLHVDGAFLNNIPIAEMATLLRGGPVLALDVTPRVEFEHNESANKGISGLQVLKDKLRGHGPYKDIPGLFDLLTRSQLLNHINHIGQVRPLASLYLQPDLTHFGLSQHHRVRAIAQAGYDLCIDEIRSWWQQHQQSIKTKEPSE